MANWSAWADGLETQADWQQWQAGEKQLADELNLPALKSVPPMQRRRLSPFAKVTLHCALEAAGDDASHVPSVFASRHGDLHKTTALIEAVAKKEDLSPTQFGLSVHNALAGLFSIFTQNTAPISAVAAGESTFIAGLVDSLVKMQINQYAKILYVYSDLKVPTCYQNYVAENEKNIAIALLLEASPMEQAQFSLAQTKLSQSEHTLELNGPQAFSFIQFLCSNQPALIQAIQQQTWVFNRANG
ncbi:beta-ketoacyl synthase chain length factor [Catenovulum sp. 2E275]|uniref:beta-ketoacyl synthase chain length factor n=1 Tax=Catenovulum sp. 2E275 TaxID=2980497 RepID=UPI0021CF4271|nr:beta-ketoacyl synthase chain length factor [Catenovulum sp. 2E275]MCU4676664.1 beta-ketoacyl synthase chain length factor [Catenovulum sp. 2E275]